MHDALISTDAGILFILAANASLWFFLEKRTGWKMFNFVPPLIFVYVLPAVFSNSGLISNHSGVYDWMGDNVLPMFLVLLLLNVDIQATIKVMGKGVWVMLIGTLGVVIGAPIGYAIVSNWLSPDSWMGYAILSGSWIGGTGNMAAVQNAIDPTGETTGSLFGLAVIADNVVYLVWLPLLLNMKRLAPIFNKFTGVTDEHLRKMKAAADEMVVEKGKPAMRDYLYLVMLGMGVTWLSVLLADVLPTFESATGFVGEVLSPALTPSTYKILLVTTFGIVLSFSPARKIPGSHAVAMALVYLFVSRMGAKTDLAGLTGEAIPFVVGAYIWIFIHGAFILGAAKVFKIDVHTAAIASAANIGGAASAPIVASFHDERLVPVSILMALIGYAVGNYASLLLVVPLLKLVAG
jgi:uncharacterized membrane protein